jgi:hypothetical protein
VTNCLLVIFTFSPDETNFLFKFEHQDWNGKFVVLLNPVYNDAVIQQRVPCLDFKEMLLPIQNPTAYDGIGDHQLFVVDPTGVAVGPIPFVVKTSSLNLVDFSPSTATCGNPICDGRHLEGTRCQIPLHGVKPFPITRFKMKLILGDHPHLGELHIRSTSLAQLFCSKMFLGLPHHFRRKARKMHRVIEAAFDFYRQNGYQFELGGILFGKSISSTDVSVHQAVGSYFRVVEPGALPFREKVDIDS